MTTVLLAERVLRGGMTWRGALVGAALALLLSLGQWVCLAGFRERWWAARWRWLAGYVVWLLPDVAMSFAQAWRFLAQPLLQAATRDLPAHTQSVALWAGVALVAAFALLSSVAPERCLFGRSRSRRTP